MLYHTRYFHDNDTDVVLAPSMKRGLYEQFREMLGIAWNRGN